MRTLNKTSSKSTLGSMTYMGHGGEMAFGPRAMRNLFVFDKNDGGGAGGAGDNADAGAGDNAGKPANHHVDTNSGKPNDGKPNDGKPNDGKPSDADASLLRELMKQKEASAELKRQLEAFEGIDPVKTREILANIENERKASEAAAKEAEEKRLREAGDFDALKRTMQTEREAERKADKELLTASELRAKTLEGRIRELKLGNEFANSSFIGKNVVFPAQKAQMIYGGYFDVSDTGQVSAFDKPAGSEGRNPLVDAAGNPIPFEDAIRKIVESDPDREKILLSQQRQGSGTRPAGETQNGAQPNRPKLFGAARIAAAFAKEAAE